MEVLSANLQEEVEKKEEVEEKENEKKDNDDEEEAQALQRQWQLVKRKLSSLLVDCNSPMIEHLVRRSRL